MVKSSRKLLSAQQAIIQVLTQDNSLMSKITGVLDRVIPNSPSTPPYIVIEGGDSIPDLTMSQPHGEKVSIILNVYSQTDGYNEVREIMSDVERILINQSLAVEESGESVCMFVSSKTGFIDPHYQVSMKVSLNL